MTSSYPSVRLVLATIACIVLLSSAAGAATLADDQTPATDHGCNAAPLLGSTVLDAITTSNSDPGGGGCCSWTQDRTTYIGGTCYYRGSGDWIEGGWYIVEYSDCTSCPCSQNQAYWSCGSWYYAGSFCQAKQ